ncbi:TIGR02678 family protein [Streptomyces sp. NPDC095613]|uniref:TIGR02678 family protein n=1 Tax=Streptomyces sp. NPDC095613 TaxID=3155540 RepID=UPI003323943B
MTTPLAEVLDGQRAADVQRAARALLKEPLLTADGPRADEFRLVRQHATELREWFERNAGWSLRVDAEAARLRKTPGVLSDATHPAREATRTALPFTRRRYVLLCLALAVLERGEAQVALGRLAEQVVLAAADPHLAAAGVTFTLERRDERLDLAAVVRLLLALGVLRRVAGDEEAYVNGAGDALYDVRRRVLAGLPATRRGPSMVAAEEAAGLKSGDQHGEERYGDEEYGSGERHGSGQRHEPYAQRPGTRARPGTAPRPGTDADADADAEGAQVAPVSAVPSERFHQRLVRLTAETALDSDELRFRAIRWKLTRCLLDDPVLYYDELTDGELAYLTRQRGFITARISELTGLVAEVRAEGIAMVDPLDDLTDVRMPEQGTHGHITLLLAGYLAAAGRAVEPAELERRVRELAAEHGGFWSKAAREPGAEPELVERAVEKLVALGLVTRTERGVLPRPALARYAVGEPVVRARGSRQAHKATDPKPEPEPKPEPKPEPQRVTEPQSQSERRYPR